MPSTFTNLLYHIVFSTKQREPLITEDFREELYKYIGGIIRAEDGILIEIGGIDDHVHLVAKLKPSMAVSEYLNKIKSNSSKWVNENKKSARRFAWQEGYAAFTVSESQVPPVREYIQNQEVHHKKISFQQEFIALLERHGISYDPQYIWD
jgi:putative transposase